ncbi:MAG: hypothetical protein V1645_02010 [archaeon]
MGKKFYLFLGFILGVFVTKMFLSSWLVLTIRDMFIFLVVCVAVLLVWVAAAKTKS